MPINENHEEMLKRSQTVKRDLDAAARSKAAKNMLDAAAAKKKATMKESYAPIGDVITLVANDQQGEATTILNDLLSARVLDSLQSHKQEIAKTLFAPSADTLAESTEELDEKKNWIAGAIKRPGALHTALHVPQGEKIPAGKLEAAAHKKGKVGQEARLAKTLKGLHEEIVQEEHESVEDFLKRGGKIKQVASHAAHGAQKKQKIKVPFRMGKAAR